MASYFIRANRKPGSFRVIEERWEDGKRTQLTVPRSAWKALGFSPQMTLDEAKERVSRLNQENTLERKKASQATRQAEKYKTIETVYIPPKLAERFVDEVLLDEMSSPRWQAKKISGWKYVQKMIKSLKLNPTDYYHHRKKIYLYFAKNATSPEYMSKLLKIINMWGYFITSYQGQPYRPIPTPKRHEKSIVESSYLDSKGYRGPSKIITPELLEQNRDKLKVAGNYEWLAISVWFGLRPEEINSLKNISNWNIEYDSDKTPILWVYQSKLTALPRNQRWKPIPCFLKEQRECLKYLQEGTFKQPLYKTMKAVFGPGYGLRGGRKGFIDLMLNREQTIENISTWMGHTSIETTWKKYRNRKRVDYKKVG